MHFTWTSIQINFNICLPSSTKSNRKHITEWNVNSRTLQLRKERRKTICTLGLGTNILVRYKNHNPWKKKIINRILSKLSNLLLNNTPLYIYTYT